METLVEEIEEVGDFNMICHDGVLYPVFEDKEGFIEVAWDYPLGDCDGEDCDCGEPDGVAE